MKAKRDCHQRRHHRGTDSPPDSRAGFAVLETVLAGLVLAIAFVSLGTAFGSNVSMASMARETTVAARFLDETMASLDAQPYDALLAMNGNTFFSQGDSSATGYSISLSVTQSAIDLLRLSVVVLDLRTGREVTRLVTHRSER